MIDLCPNNPIKVGGQYTQGEHVVTSKIVVQNYCDKEDVLFFQLCRVNDALTPSWIDCLIHSSENFNDVYIRGRYIFIGFQGNYLDLDSNPTYPNQMNEL